MEKLTARGLLKVICGTETVEKLKIIVKPRAMTPFTTIITFEGHLRDWLALLNCSNKPE